MIKCILFCMTKWKNDGFDFQNKNAHKRKASYMWCMPHNQKESTVVSRVGRVSSRMQKDQDLIHPPPSYLFLLFCWPFFLLVFVGENFVLVSIFVWFFSSFVTVCNWSLMLIGMGILRFRVFFCIWEMIMESSLCFLCLRYEGQLDPIMMCSIHLIIMLLSPSS